MQHDSSRLMIGVCFAVIYVIWGSTYLAIRIALEGFPPFFLAGSRFLLPGILLYGWLRLRGTPKPTDVQWWWSVVTGAIMLVGASGALVWGEQRVPSAVAALLFTTVPLWMIVLESLINRGSLGGWRIWSGLVLGLSGVALLVSPSSRELLGVDAVGALVILGAALSWAFGSIVSRRVTLPRSPLMTVAVQMMAGGTILYFISGMTGEWHTGAASWSISARTVSALVYLGFIGALCGLSAYTYLLQRVSPAAVSTYAFVNPVIAVFLGWFVAGEPMGSSIFAAASMIVIAVVLIQSASWRSAERLKQRALQRAETARVSLSENVGAAPSPRCREGTP